MAIALVSHVAKTSSGTSAAIDTTGSSLILVVVGNTTAGESSVSDSNGNTWLRLFYGPVNTGRVWIYGCANPTVGSGHTFTVTTANPSFCVAAFSGTGDYPFFKMWTSNGSSGATSIQAGSITPTANGGLVIAALAYRDTTAVSIDGGFTITDQNPYVGAVAVGSALAYLIQGGAAAANPTWNWTNSAICTALLGAVRPPASGGGGAFAFA
jgi:hypothetical protein